MPKPIKKKVLKKPILKEDKIKGTFIQTTEFLGEKRNVLLIILVSIIALTILSLIIISYNSSLKKKAYALEIEAYNYYYGINLKEPLTDEERLRKALELYKKSVETRPSPTALFYLGNCYYNLSDYTKAIEEYERFTKKFRKEKNLLPIVFQKLASAYLNKEDKDMAIKTLDKLADLDRGIFKDTALILQARYYERWGETEKAKGKYKELIKQFPLSPWVHEASSKIEQETENQKE